jgi:tetratricopeptide (TPR) repeat protein
MDMLTALLNESTEPGRKTSICTINGTAGVGKTTLALQWAHRVADQFPDGQLYVNLRGFDASGAAMLPDEAMRCFLDAFGVAPERIPVDANAQGALYRSLLAKRRVLVVLDNAVDSNQVRTLLPGSPDCFVVVTSRNRLGGLVAREGARPLSLDILSKSEATELLARRLGPDRVAAESGSIAALIDACARLPLALAIMAARVALRRDISLSALVMELADEHNRLDALDTGDSGDEVRAVFSWSYQALSPQSARQFRILGLDPGPDASLDAIASLAGLRAEEARRGLFELTQACLLDEYPPGRYRLHDLLRTYAKERTLAEDSSRSRRRAVRRILDHYLHSSALGAAALAPHRPRIDLRASSPGAIVAKIASHEQAMEWFMSEYATLLSAIGYAVREKLEVYSWQLPLVFSTFLHRRGYWHEYASTHEAALGAAVQLGDRLAQAHVHRDLGHVYSLTGRHDDARAHHVRALALWRRLGDAGGHAHTLYIYGWACEANGDYIEALASFEQALELYRTVGNRQGQARALNSVGWCHSKLERNQVALTCYHDALRLMHEGDHRDPHAKAHILTNLAQVCRDLGRYEESANHCREATQLYRVIGSQYYEARALTFLGDAEHALGRYVQAQAALRRALDILIDLGHSDSENVRAKLVEVLSAAPGKGSG